MNWDFVARIDTEHVRTMAKNALKSIIAVNTKSMKVAFKNDMRYEYVHDTVSVFKSLPSGIFTTVYNLKEFVPAIELRRLMPLVDGVWNSLAAFDQAGKYHSEYHSRESGSIYAAKDLSVIVERVGVNYENLLLMFNNHADRKKLVAECGQLRETGKVVKAL